MACTPKEISGIRWAVQPIGSLVELLTGVEDPRTPFAKNVTGVPFAGIVGITVKLVNVASAPAS
jgi:hypothetical protein